MALTRDFKATVLARVRADPNFRDALLKEGVESMLAGDVDTGKAILRDYIKATVGFEQLGAETRSSPKSLIRLFGPTGNPQPVHTLLLIDNAIYLMESLDLEELARQRVYEFLFVAPEQQVVAVMQSSHPEALGPHFAAADAFFHALVEYVQRGY